MKLDDLSFKTVDENGEEHINDITNVIPNNKNDKEPYVTFTDYTLNENDEFVQNTARLIKQDGHYYLETNLTKEEQDYINDQLKDEIIDYIGDVLEENRNE